MHVDDDELILRRIPIKQCWYDADACLLSRLAFNPNQRDTTGLSVSRARCESHPDFLTPAEFAACGRNPCGYFVAVLLVGELREQCISVVSKPEHDNPGHAELPQLTYDSRRSDEAIDITERLAENLTLRVEGAFVPTSNEDEERVVS